MRFEVRLAEAEPTLGLRPARVAGSTCEMICKSMPAASISAMRSSPRSVRRSQNARSENTSWPRRSSRSSGVQKCSSIAIRFAGSNPDLIKKHVTEAIKLTPDVIVANSIPVMAALHQLTHTIPIVFAALSNPVGQGYISNLARPGRNITGFSFIEPEIIGKWINLLSDVNPSLSRVILMFNPDTALNYDVYLQAFKATPQQSSVEVNTAHVRSIAETDSVIAKAGRETGSGLIAPADVFIVGAREAILKSAKQHKVAVISVYRQFVVEGGLMSYGPNTADIFRRSSEYVDRILKGASPGDLPAQSPTKFELVINLKTARDLGLPFHDTFLELADEVIE